MGHHHGGRQFPATAHGTMAKIIAWIMGAQAVLGIYLKSHVHEGRRARRLAVIAHGVLGKAFPIIGWTQMLLGVVTALGYCMGGKLGQCLAHYIMGSAFVSHTISGWRNFLRLTTSTPADWLRDHPPHHAPSRLGMARTNRQIARIPRQLGHHVMGNRQHLYRTSRCMEQELVAQGHATYDDGCVVVGGWCVGYLFESRWETIVCAGCHVSREGEGGLEGAPRWLTDAILLHSASS